MDGVAIQRARPWLGTLVEMRVEGLAVTRAIHAIEAAFAEVAGVHRGMSFHEPGSDLSRLHRARVGMAVRVDARTREVLECALLVAEQSNGCFDPTIAGQQVERGVLPRPDSPFAPDPQATWRDIELLDDNHVRLLRPLWIDLGGIAKGYAVDRAIGILIEADATQGCVNAGGDLRVFGPRTEHIGLRTEWGIMPGVELANAALAGSANVSGELRPHLHGRTREPADALRVHVIAARCMLADALTKVVLAADASASSSLLARFGARACVHTRRWGWRILEAAA